MRKQMAQWVRLRSGPPNAFATYPHKDRTIAPSIMLSCGAWMWVSEVENADVTFWSSVISSRIALGIVTELRPVRVGAHCAQGR